MKDSLRKEAKINVKSTVGFRHVIDLLSSERKLIVGHNCFLGKYILFDLWKATLCISSFAQHFIQ